MIQYVILLFLISILGFYIYIKWSHPFWSVQPVYHNYDVFFWGRNGIIRKTPTKNKFFNKKIQFCKTDDFTKWDNMQKLISAHFLKNGDNHYSPSLNEIQPYFSGHNLPCFISVYTTDELVFGSDAKEKIIGTITSAPLTFQTKSQKENVYYIDNLCIDKTERKKGLACQLIQTHEYHQSSHSKTQISFFKREGRVPLLVPFVKYKCTVFSMVYWQEVKCHNKIMRVTPNNIHLFNDFLQSQLFDIDYAFYTNIGNILSLVKSENIIIYMCITNEIVGCYFFRKSCTKIEEKDVLTLYASLRKSNVEDFIHFFKCSLSHLMKTENYVYLCVEELGENIKISENLKLKTYPTEVISSSYFLYNYIHPTVNAKKCFIIT